MAVTLTDDELVGIAVQAGKSWQSALPTVRVDDATALGAAALSGARSLALRAQGTEEFEAARAAVAAAAGRAPEIVMYGATVSDPSVPVGPHAALFLLGDNSALLDVGTPVGIHELVVMSLAEAQSWVAQAVDNAWTERATTSQPEGTAFVLAQGLGTDAPDIVAITRDSVWSGSVVQSDTSVNLELADELPNEKPSVSLS